MGGSDEFQVEDQFERHGGGAAGELDRYKGDRPPEGHVRNFAVWDPAHQRHLIEQASRSSNGVDEAVREGYSDQPMTDETKREIDGDDPL